MVERGEKESQTPCKVQYPGVRPYLSRTHLIFKKNSQFIIKKVKPLDSLFNLIVFRLSQNIYR
jgi:hypothetical protein